MTRRSPTPVRFDNEVASRLTSFVASHPGLSLSAAANLLVDEGLRMAEHPGVVFRDGPTGRRAGLAAGPDVWEIMRAVKSARSTEADLDEDEMIAMVSENSGVALGKLRTAVRYWANYPAEIDDEIAAAEHAEIVAEVAWRRERDLLAK
jgi:hypothetical protein